VDANQNRGCEEKKNGSVIHEDSLTVTLSQGRGNFVRRATENQQSFD
jgi:hypothetical protein